jgi:hypothetical protein
MQKFAKEVHVIRNLGPFANVSVTDALTHDLRYMIWDAISEAVKPLLFADVNVVLAGSWRGWLEEISSVQK